MLTNDHSNNLEPIAQLMLLGTFHFQDRGLDAYQPRHALDILSTQRQEEVAEIVERLAGYQPTKIAIERRPERQDEINQSYQAYREGSFDLPADEIYQLGFRLAKRMNHRQVYCVDAWGRYYEPPLDLEEYALNRTSQELRRFLNEELDFDPFRDLQTYAQEHGQAEIFSKWMTSLQSSGEVEDQAKTQRSLNETLVLMNTEEAIRKSHAAYFTGPFEIGSGNRYPGVDTITAWYNRNLRIFANLQRITENHEERILLIIGSGHIPILRHCVENSLGYKLVEVHEYLA